MSETARILGLRNSAEQNKKVVERQLNNNEYFKKMREGIRRHHGIDISDKAQLKEGGKFPVLADGFSFKAMESKMIEVDAATSFVQLLRAGVQTIVNDMYQSVETTHEEWTHAVSSDKEEELYAPLQGIGFPSEVGRQEKYGESGAAGLDIKLRSRKYGELYPVEMELIMNDQTGQVKNMVGLLAEYAKQVIEVIVYAKLASVAGMSYSNLLVPVSETKPATEANYPYSQAFVGGGANRPASFGAFNIANFELARQALLTQKNMLGLKMSVKPGRLLVSPKYEVDAATILNSSFYPAGAQSAGVTGGAFAVNFFKGIANLTVSSWLFDNTGVISGLSKAWYVMDDRRPWFIVQLREPASVVQEDPNSGAGFERDIIRHKMRIQGNADFIDPRFVFQGSDGSV